MIHKAYTKSEIARRYFEKKGEKLSNQDAINRWRMVRHPDKAILKSVFEEIRKEQKQLLQQMNTFPGPFTQMKAS